MVVRLQFCVEFRGRIDGRIDFPTKLSLSGAQRRNDFGERHLSNHEDIHVTCAPLLMPSHGTVNRGDTDAFGQWGHGRPQYVADTNRFDHEALQIVEDRALWISLVEDLPTPHGALENTTRAEPFHLPLHGTQTHSRDSRNVAQVKGLVRMTVQQRQYRAAGSAKQGRGQVVIRGYRTHLGYNCTLFGYELQGPASRSLEKRSPLS